MRRFTCLAFAFVCMCCWAGCESDDEGSCEPNPNYSPEIEPAEFSAVVDNSFMPLEPGSKWVYEGGGERIEIVVLDSTKNVMGVSCTVVRDTVSEEGEVVEDTFDWFAQDSNGNVWYMGEDSKEMDEGEVASTEGSWQGGVDGALPGYIMLAEPENSVGLIYRQEYYACEAEDMAEIVSADESVSVPAGNFTGCFKFHEWNKLEDGSDEFKYFCPGVGLVLEVDDEGQRIELVTYSIP